MTQINVGKDPEAAEKQKARDDAFFEQTIDENNTRLNNKWAAVTDMNELRQATLDEIKFLQSQLLARS